MKRLLVVAILTALSLLLVGCGYQNPYLAAKRDALRLETFTGEPVLLHAAMWDNRTNETGLQLVFYNTLHNWFQNSERIRLTRSTEEAKYTLTGEIVAIDEGLTRGTVRLTVRYGLDDLEDNRTVWQVPRQTFSENFFITGNAAQTQNNKRRALEKIADDLAESIYMRTLHLLRERNQA
jgi:hypothetical protein